MNASERALGYLIARTTTNRVIAQVRRLKRPRYVAMLLFGVAYFWLIFLRPPSSSSVPSTFGGGLLMMAGVLMAASVLWMWLFGKNTASLAFLPAEVQLLFPAPLSRRALICYKIVRTQLVVLLNALIWTMLSRRFGVAVSAPQRYAAAWGLFTVLSLHPLGLALMRVPPLSPARRTLLVGLKGVAVLVIVVVAISVVPALSQQSTLGFLDRMSGVSKLLETPPTSIIIAPFRVLGAPFLADSLATFARAFGAVLGIIALHLIWVFSTNVGFEEVAATASIKLAGQRAAVKAFQAGGVAAAPTSKTARSWLPLRPTGHPAVAIAWKNTLALVRTRMLFSLIVPVVVMVLVTSMSSRGLRHDGGNTLIYLILAMMLFTMGPRVLRNDLRQDMLSLASLKTYPLSGATMVFAEIASPTLLLAALQIGLLLAAWQSALSGASNPQLQMVGPTLLLLIPLAVLMLNATNVTIQNGIALIFPGWVRMGPTAGGVEAMGQNMMMTFGSLFAFFLSFLIPAAAGALVYFITATVMAATRAAALSSSVAVAIVLLSLQLMLMMRWFGRVFDRTEASALT